jgi:hypothetical protein
MEATATMIGNATGANRITKQTTFQPVALRRVYKSDFQKKNTLTAELEQKVSVISHYPSAQVKSGGLYDVSDFNIGTTDFESVETRVCWLDVPDTATEADVMKKLQALKKARIVKVLSNHPILTDNQKNGIDRGLTTLDVFANRQVVRYPEDHENSGELILFNNKPMYKVNVFVAEAAENADMKDMRTADPSDFYASPEIAEELGEGISVPGLKADQSL